MILAPTGLLPSAYPGHPHATEEFRSIAETELIFLAEVGSGVHGTALAGTDDVDQMGVCIEPPAYVTGLRRFEQFERHTAWDRSGGLHERSGPGDLDVTVYSLRKFCRLALEGNPSILTLLFVPETAIVHQTLLGRDLLARAWQFVSLQAADRYLGYLYAQRRGLRGEGRVNRPELIERYGFDTKFAGHAIRLGVQGIELMRTGRVELPMATYWRQHIRAVKRGEVSYVEVLTLINGLEDELRSLRQENPLGLPEHPDRDVVDYWLHRAYTGAWAGKVFR